MQIRVDQTTKYCINGTEANMHYKILTVALRQISTDYKGVNPDLLFWAYSLFSVYV